MRTLCHKSVVILAIVAIFSLTRQSAYAAPRTYTINQQASIVTASGQMLELFDVLPQGTGSLVTSYTGTIVTDRASGTIQFISGVNGSNIDATSNGNWLPGLTSGTSGTPAAGDYGGFIEFGETYLAAQNLVADFTSAPTAISSGQFDQSGITISFKGGSSLRYRYDLGSGPVFGVQSLTGSQFTSNLTGTGTVTVAGTIETLTMPIDVTIPLIGIVPQFPGEVGYLKLTGTLVATATLPFAPGDFDHDGDVDGADFVAWQTNFPKATGATAAQGDADGDNDVDGADFAVWQSQFPQPPAPGVAPVPEPGAAMLFLIGAAAFCGRKILRLK